MSNRDLVNLKKKVFNTPQLIMVQDFQNIIEYLENPVRTDFERNPVEAKLKSSDFSKDEDYRKYRLEQLNINPETMQGLIKIEGTLVNRAGQVQACVELTSYEGIKATLKAQIDEGVKEVVMVFDTGGGEAYGCFSTSATLRKMADDNNVKLIAYVDGYACSAGYALASSAHEIIANPQATVGSVGVVVQLINNNEALKKAGYSRTFVYAGDNKVPFDENGEFDKTFISTIQSSINKTYKRFTNLVANNRGMQESDVVKTQASVYDADEAISIGFVDKLMETDEFFEDYFPSLRQTQNQSQEMNTEENMTDTKTKEAVTSVELNAETHAIVALADLDKLTETASQLEASTLVVASLQEQLATATSRVQELENDILSAQADAVIATRRASLEDVLGKDNDQVAEVLKATASLDDPSFLLICNAYTTGFEKKEEAMTEIGKHANTEQARAQTLEEQIVAKLNKTK